MLIRIANKEDPDKTIGVCTVCLGLYGRKLVFNILEHLHTFTRYCVYFLNCFDVESIL